MAGSSVPSTAGPTVGGPTWRGGSAHSLQLNAEWRALAARAAAAVGAEYAGVDLLPARDGTVSVLEVNGIPGWRGLQEATSLDVAGALVDLLASPAPVSYTHLRAHETR